MEIKFHLNGAGEFARPEIESAYKGTRKAKQGRSTWANLKANRHWFQGEAPERLGEAFIESNGGDQGALPADDEDSEPTIMHDLEPLPEEADVVVVPAVVPLPVAEIGPSDGTLVAIEEPHPVLAEVMATREPWLMRAAQRMAPWFSGCAIPEVVSPKLRVSCGFPKGGKGGRGTTIGQCWGPDASKDQSREIFVSPVLENVVDVLSTLLHEMAHAYLPAGVGHKGPFIKVCKHLGFTKPWTQTPCTDDLTARLTALAEDLGPYPHASLNPKMVKKQTTRLILSVCSGCGAKWRSSAQVIEEMELAAGPEWGDAGLKCPCGGTVHPDNAEGA